MSTFADRITPLEHRSYTDEKLRHSKWIKGLGVDAGPVAIGTIAISEDEIEVLKAINFSYREFSPSRSGPRTKPSETPRLSEKQISLVTDLGRSFMALITSDIGPNQGVKPIISLGRYHSEHRQSTDLRWHIASEPQKLGCLGYQAIFGTQGVQPEFATGWLASSDIGPNGRVDKRVPDRTQDPENLRRVIGDLGTVYRTLEAIDPKREPTLHGPTPLARLAFNASIELGKIVPPVLRVV